MDQNLYQVLMINKTHPLVKRKSMKLASTFKQKKADINWTNSKSVQEMIEELWDSKMFFEKPKFDYLPTRPEIRKLILRIIKYDQEELV